MLPIKSQNITPKKRWQILLTNPLIKQSKMIHRFLKTKTKRKKALSGSQCIKGVKFLYKTQYINVFRGYIKHSNLVCTSQWVSKQRASYFSIYKNIFSNSYLLGATPYCRPGFVLKSLINMSITHKNLIGQILPLYLIPLNSFIKNIFNRKNTHATYALSGSSTALKRKPLKKIKLSYVELPSKMWILLGTNTFCTFSHGIKSFKSKIVEGGWNASIKSKKKINVRGVAMNPVDHPNGGRTKAKQPELSPWGWIAKKNK